MAADRRRLSCQSWDDIEQHLAYIEQEYHCHVSITIERSKGRGKGAKRLCWRVEATRVAWLATATAVVSVSSAAGCHTQGPRPEALSWALWKLDGELADRLLASRRMEPLPLWQG